MHEVEYLFNFLDSGWPVPPQWGCSSARFGRDGAHDGLLEFTETKYIATQLVTPVPLRSG
jgi:hypothetical protein